MKKINTKEKNTKKTNELKNKFIGTAKLILIIGIIYTAYYTFFGTAEDDYITKAMVAPQFIFAAIVSFKQFIKK